MSHQGLTATWMKDNKPLDGSVADRAKIVAKENHFTLELSKTVAGDSGQYTCRVTNPNNESVTCSAQLEVHQRKLLRDVIKYIGVLLYDVCFVWMQAKDT